MLTSDHNECICPMMVRTQVRHSPSSTDLLLPLPCPQKILTRKRNHSRLGEGTIDARPTPKPPRVFASRAPTGKRAAPTQHPAPTGPQHTPTRKNPSHS